MSGTSPSAPRLEAAGGTPPATVPGRALVVGTAGHVDHGKTSLVRALTGTDTDRWREEKERGLTIDIGFARLDLGADAEVGVVDVPGHEDFVKNMLAGATGVDLLLLAVAADEGPMPQTIEHLAIARLLGVRRGVVALTKADRAEPAWLDLVREATADELRRVMGPVTWPTVEVSSVTGRGLDRLRELLREAAAEVPSRPAEDLFRLPVDRSFSVHGTGTVVTGTSWSGRLRAGEDVRALPGGATARVRGLQVHGREREEVTAGRRCALALVGPSPGEVGRGSTIVAGGPWRAVDRLGVRLEVLPHSTRELDEGRRVRAYLGTREVMARLALGGAGPLGPADAGWAVLRLEAPLVARARDRIVIRFYSPVTTVAGALVAELEPPPDWSARTAEWGRILEGTPAEAFRAAVALSGGAGRPAAELPLATGLAAPVVQEARADLPPEGVLEQGGRWFTEEALAGARRAVETALDGLHEARRRASAVSLEAVRSASAEAFAGEIVELALRELVEEGRVAVEGGRIRRPGHRAALTDREREARGALLEALEAGGFEPPPVGELPARLRVDRAVLHDLLTLLEESGEVVAVSPEIYVTAGRARELVRRAREVLRGRSPAAPTDFKQALDVSRKYLIPILEYLDRRGVTRRTGRGRELAGGQD